MAIELTEGLTIGLLSEAESRVQRLESDIDRAEGQARRVEAELQDVVARLGRTRDLLHTHRRSAEQAAQTIGEGNNRLARMHQETDTLQRRADALRDAMAQATEGDAQRQLRRNRAVLLVEIEDRKKAVQKLTDEVAAARQALQGAQRGELEEADAQRRITAQLDTLQAQLPNPQLYLDAFAARATRAHCMLQLDKDARRWRADIVSALAPVRQLHTALRAGRYRIDTNSEFIGGRALGTAEAIYAAAAAGEVAVARDLFLLATDPNLFFHHIFQVFRIWCLGLYLGGAAAELQQLVQLHEYAQGVRGAYAQAYLGILKRDERGLAMALKNLVLGEWQLWQRNMQERGLGVVNVNALALCKMARAANLRVPPLGPTVPQFLL